MKKCKDHKGNEFNSIERKKLKLIMFVSYYNVTELSAV